MPAYCAVADVTPLLGDMELSATMDVQSYINRTAVEIDLALGLRYETPIVTTNYYTTQLLAVVNADLAAAQLLMAQASAGEDDRVNAYAQHLWMRADARLKVYLLGGDRALPGGVLLASDDVVGPVAIFHEDSESSLERYYRFVQGEGVVW